MKSISVICPNLSGKGGTETVLKSFFKHPLSNYDIQLVLPYKPVNKEWLSKLNYIETKKYSRFSFLNKVNGLIFLIKFLAKNKNNIYICLSSQLIFILALFRFFTRRKFIIISWIHFSLFHEKTVNTKYLKKADVHLAISSGIKKQMEKIGINSDKIFTIYNPINSSEKLFESTDSKKIIHFAYIGRVTYRGQKNIQELLKAILSVKGDWILYIIGTGDGLDECKIFVKKNGLENKIFFLGWLDDPWNHIDYLDAVVLTSKYEGLPMVLLEAISRGIPCISSNCPTGPEDIIENNVNSYLYECGDIGKLTELLQGFIDGSNFIDPEVVRKSISKFYVEEYMRNFGQCIDKIVVEEDQL